jgi:hypothetical protein
VTVLICFDPREMFDRARLICEMIIFSFPSKFSKCFSSKHQKLQAVILIISVLVIFTVDITIEQSKEGILSDAILLSESPFTLKRDSNQFMTPKKQIIVPFTGFIENNGQIANSRIKYYYSNNNASIGFGVSRIYFSNVQTESRQKTDSMSFELAFPGAQKVFPMGIDKRGHSTNYFIEDTSLTNIASWSEVWYYDLYPGIDLRYYMIAEGLKYEFVVHPRADHGQITVEASDTVKIHISATKIFFHTMSGSRCTVFEETGLKVFQDDGTEIPAQFISKTGQNSYGFEVAAYDLTQDLIIDPLWVPFSTFIGGTSDEIGLDIAVDANGNSYITGFTFSNDFPTVNAHDDTHNGDIDFFVVKLNTVGNLLFSTFIGGTDADFAGFISLDAYNNCYITGETSSNDFPTVNAYDNTFNGSSDAFVVKLNATGDDLLFSTFIGGTSDEIGLDIAVDASGNSYITGETYSNDFPTVNAYDNTFNGSSDVFVVKLNAAGDDLLFSTFIGGTSDEVGFSITFDANNNSYITGETYSNDFPTMNAYDDTYNGTGDAFIVKLNATGDDLLFSTFIGGTSYEAGWGIAVDDSGNSYITGDTSSNDFPTMNAYDNTYSGTGDTFILKLNATGDGLLHSTFIGGTGREYAYNIAVDASGNSYIIGDTTSNDFPTVNAYDDTYNGSSDAFVVKLNAAGDDLLFSTFIGGTGDDFGYSIAVDASGNSYITGETSSNDFPTVNAYDDTYNGSSDIFVVKFSTDIFSPTITLTSPNNDTIHRSSIVINVDVTDDHLATVLYHWDNNTNQTWSSDYQVPVPTGDGEHVLHIHANDTAGNWAYEVYVFITDDTAPTITLTSPNNDTIQRSSIVINVDVTDDHLATVLYHWGSDTNQTWSSDYQVPVPTGDGEHVLHVYANDTASNGLHQVFVFITDDTAPTIISVEYSSFLDPHQDLLIDIIAMDNYTPPSNITVRIDYGFASSGFFPEYGFASYQDGKYSLVIAGKDEHTTIWFEVTVYDNLSNSFESGVFSTTWEVNFAPEVTLANTINNTMIAETDLIELLITDDNLDWVLYRWDDGENQTLTSPWSVTVPQVEDWHWLHIIVNDSRGITTTRYYLFFVDTTPPIISLIDPENDTVLSNTSVIDITASDSNLEQVWYHWDSEASKTIASPWNVIVPVAEDYHWLYFYCNDSVGHFTSRTFRWYINSPPVIILHNTLNNSELMTNEALLFNITDSTLVEVTFSWNQADSTIITSPYTISLPREKGWYELSVDARDSFDWVNVQYYRFYVFDVNDLLSIDSNQDNPRSVYETDYFNLSFTVINPNNIPITLDIYIFGVNDDVLEGNNSVLTLGPGEQEAISFYIKPRHASPHELTVKLFYKGQLFTEYAYSYEVYPLLLHPLILLLVTISLLIVGVVGSIIYLIFTRERKKPVRGLKAVMGIEKIIPPRRYRRISKVEKRLRKGDRQDSKDKKLPATPPPPLETEII